MYLDEEQRIVDAGGTIRRAVLDDKLKQPLYRELNGREEPSPEARDARLADLARAEDLPVVADPQMVLTYFEARWRFEMLQFRSCTDKDLERLRQNLDRLRGPYYEEGHERWRVNREAAKSPVEPVDADQRMAPGVQFVPHVLPDRYPFTGRIQEAV